jgi:hypothetical protein
MRTLITLAAVLLITAPGLAQGRLTSPYRQQFDTGLRGLDAKEIDDLKAGNGMGLARAAELNNYPGPRHVLEAIQEGKLTASQEQRERVQRVFNTMNHDAVRIGAQILGEEQTLETGFRSATITDTELRARVATIAALQGQLRVIHLAAHLATRAVLSESQLARYNELRGYAAGADKDQKQEHKH